MYIKPKYRLFIIVSAICIAVYFIVESVLYYNYAQRIEVYRKEMHTMMLNPEESPLEEQEIQIFTGLNYFSIDRDYKVSAEWKELSDPDTVIISLSGGRKDLFLEYGEISFELQGFELTLLMYKKLGANIKQPLFVPFKDNTNRHTTYAGGRYLDIELREGNDITLDFNLAYNPFCAYNSNYKCPLSPLENILPITIEAGEKAWKH